MPRTNVTMTTSPSRRTDADGPCAHCGSARIHLKHVTRSYGRGKDLLVIEGIPMWDCPACGESYFTARTMHELERIKALRKSVAMKRAVSVATFEPAAA